MALLTACAALAWASDASALGPLRVAAPPALRAELLGGLRAGEHAFGRACPAGIAVAWRPLPRAARGLPGVVRLAQADRARCRIELSLAVYRAPAWRRRYYSRPWLCSLIVHEYGHLAGRPHSSLRTSPMYPLLWRVYGPCGRPL